MERSTPAEFETDEASGLIQRIRRGEPSAWRQLVDQYEGRLLAFARSRLQDASLAEDIVQETLLGFLTSLPNFEETRTSTEAFLFRIAAYKITDVLRKQGRRPSVRTMEDPLTVMGAARHASSLARSREAGDQQRHLLRTRLAELLAEWKQKLQFERLKVCELIYVRGWSNKQVAETLHLTEQQVANHKQALTQRLKVSG